MVTIIFHSHPTTLDNESGVASGHNDVELSKFGIKEAKALGKQYIKQNFSAIFCSDLQRSYKTAEFAFGNKFTIIKDPRLRECDYGQDTLKSKELIKSSRFSHINIPYSGGESYLQVVSRVKDFLVDLLRDYDGKQIMIIGHAGTRIGLEYWIHQVSIEESLNTIKKDRRGIKYELTELYPLRIYSYHLVDDAWLTCRHLTRLQLLYNYLDL